MHVAHGVTRTVLVTRRWAIKVPTTKYPRNWIRGYLANQSEWRQRDRPGVNRPLCTLAHLVVVHPAADVVGHREWGHGPWVGRDGDDAKPCSWGRFGGAWRLIDFDRAWVDPRGIVGPAYYAIQEWRARRWMRLPTA